MLLKEYLALQERQYILEAISKNNSIVKTAKLLGIGRETLHYKIKKYKIQYTRPKTKYIKKNLNITPLEEIEDVLLNEYGLAISVIYDKKNIKTTDDRLHTIKEFIYKFLKEECKCTTPTIAKVLKRSGHSTIVTSLQRINNQITVDRKLFEEYEEFKNKVNNVYQSKLYNN